LYFTINLIAMTCFLLYGFFVFKHRRYGAYLVFLYIAQLWSIVSCFYIETGIYITEQKVYSFSTGATFRLVIYNTVFFTAVVAAVNALTKRNQVEKRITLRNKQLWNLWFIPIYMVATAMFANSLLTFIAYSNNYTRFNFWDYAIFPKVGFLYQFFYVLIFIAGFLYRVNKGNRKYQGLAITSFILFNGSMILIGHKFSPIYMSTLLFLIPILSENASFLVRNKKRIIVYGLIIVGIFLTLSINEYAKSVGEENALNFVVYRILGLQGHLAWGTDLLVQTGNVNYNSNFSNEIAELIEPTSSHSNVGMKKLMWAVGGQVGSDFINNGVNFTMGFPIITAYMVGGFQATVLLSFLGAVFGLLIAGFNYFLQKNELLISIIFCKIFIDCLSLFTMGNFYVVFNKQNLFLLFVIVTYLPIYLYKTKPYKRNTKFQTITT
jgi:hypothetical protein